MRVQVEHGTVGDRNGEKYLALDRVTEQMATPQRQDHNRDVTTPGLKSPPEQMARTHMLSGANQGLFLY